MSGIADPDRKRTIHVCGANSRAQHGPGPLLHIMAYPPNWLVDGAAGYVPALRPQGAEQDLMRSLLKSRQSGEIVTPDDPTLTAYRTRYTDRLRHEALLVGPDLDARRAVAAAFLADGHPPWPAAQLYKRESPRGYPIPDGATLVCTCARAEAEQGRCHRVWAAQVLMEAGFRVVLDGRELAAGDSGPSPVTAGPLFDTVKRRI